jgi:predicted amidophosphoribosyltransferase
MYAVKNNDIVIVCKRCGKELDFWKHYKDCICEECNEYLDRRVEEINKRLEEKRSLEVKG